MQASLSGHFEQLRTLHGAWSELTLCAAVLDGVLRSLPARAPLAGVVAPASDDWLTAYA